MTKDEALKLALMAFKEINYDQAYANEISAIQEALAQPEQEPVQTEPNFEQRKQILDNLERCHHRDSKHEFLRVWIRDWTNHKLLRQTPPQRKLWVGLTDEDIKESVKGMFGNGDPWLGFARAIEAKLKEKNT